MRLSTDAVTKWNAVDHHSWLVMCSDDGGQPSSLPLAVNNAWCKQPEQSAAAVSPSDSLLKT